MHYLDAILCYKNEILSLVYPSMENSGNYYYNDVNVSMIGVMFDPSL